MTGKLRATEPKDILGHEQTCDHIIKNSSHQIYVRQFEDWWTLQTKHYQVVNMTVWYTSRLYIGANCVSFVKLKSKGKKMIDAKACLFLKREKVWKQQKWVSKCAKASVSECSWPHFQENEMSYLNKRQNAEWKKSELFSCSFLNLFIFAGEYTVLPSFYISFIH